MRNYHLKRREIQKHPNDCIIALVQSTKDFISGEAAAPFCLSASSFRGRKKNRGQAAAALKEKEREGRVLRTGPAEANPYEVGLEAHY